MSSASDVRLPDGGRILVRPIRPEDKEVLRAGFERLSPESRYRRFLSPANELGPRTLRYLTEIDHHRHEALVAFAAATGEGIGVARFVRLPEDPRTAELAVAVVDDWQHRGVGTALLVKLVERAREEGVERFSALVLAENKPMLNLIEELGHPRLVHREPGTVELILELPPEGIGEHLPRLLRLAARRAVDVLATALGTKP